MGAGGQRHACVWDGGLCGRLGAAGWRLAGGLDAAGELLVSLLIAAIPRRHDQRDVHDSCRSPATPRPPVQEAVRLAAGTLVCLDPGCVPFTRIWCLFEWWTTLRVSDSGPCFPVVCVCGRASGLCASSF